MYDSIKPWLKCPIKVLPYTGVDAYADKQFGEPFEVRCYYVGEVTVVNDPTGTEVVSNGHFYYDPTQYSIGLQDKVIWEGREQDIITTSTYIDGNTGRADLKTVYL